MTFKIVIIMSCILAGGVALSDWLVFSSAKQLMLNSTLSNMEKTLSLEVERLTREIDHTREEAIQLARSTDVKGFLHARQHGSEDVSTQSTEGEWRSRLEESFAQAIEARGHLQIRLLDVETGMELVRVNRPEMGLIPIPVRGSDLQYKGDTDYFTAGKNLKNGVIYLSDITLNRENQQLVEPYQPTQRMVAPVFYNAEHFETGASLSVLELAEQLRHYDQQRTLATMRIAQSGNLVWQSRYHQAISTLDKVLNKLVLLADDESQQPRVQLSQLHLQLKEAELQTIDAAHQGLLNYATRQIIGDHYWTLKQAFTDSLEKIITLLEAEYIADNYKATPKALLVINTDANTLLNTLDDGQNESTLLVNSRGQYLHHPIHDKRWRFEKNGQDQGIQADEPWVWQSLLESHPPKLAFDEHRELHIVGKVLFDSNNRDRFLGLVLTQQEAQVLRPIQRFRAQSIYSSLVAIFLSALAIALFTRRQLKPISMLTQQAEAIANSQKSLTLHIPQAEGEVKTMAKAFDTLISRLQKQTQEANNNALAVNQLATTLEQRVNERTAELAASTQKAEAASIAKSQFLATMSHEIRTPMNGVLGMAQLLDKSELTPQQRYYLNTINQSGEALLSIINDILDFSKIEAGKLELEPIEFDLEHIAHEALHLLAANAHQKNLELIFHYDVHSPRYFRGDPGRIRQILINLVGNAVKFTEQGHVQLNIHYGEGDNGSNQLHFEVADTGMGIAEEKQSQLFDVFTQADASTTRRHGGTGLGLAISKRLIDLMGGNIGVKSAPHQGSLFWFNLPLEACQSPPVRMQAKLDGINTLIVDDNEINCNLLQQLLQHWGMSVTTAKSGAAALTKIAQATQINRPFQLVLLDYMMPDCDGLTLGTEIHKHHRIPLVLLTSASERGNANELREAGFSAYLPKPCKSNTLKKALALALGLQPVEQQHTLLTQYEIEEQRDHRDVSPSFNGHVLLVEDNLVNQEVATELLSHLGLSMDIAENGNEAVARWKNGCYDLILMDCLMPEMDGFQATRMIRELEPEHTHIPIVALTANVMANDKQACFDAGMDDFLGKPIEQDALVEKLDYWLNKAQKAKSVLPQESALKDDNDNRSVNMLVDEQHFKTMRERMKKRFQLILSAYFEESESLINAFKQAAEQNDLDIMVRSVHSLKSSSASLGAQQISQLSATLEHRYQAGDTADWQREWEELAQLFQRTMQAMKILDESLPA